MKKTLLILLTLIIGINLNTQAQNFSAVNNGKTIYYYIISNNQVSVAENPNLYIGHIIIPDFVTYQNQTYSVTSISSGAFQWCSGLTSITIPNSVTSIDFWAFEGCSGLTSVTIPNSVTSIGDGAFEGCSGLTSLTIGNSVTSISEDAFGGCSGLTSLTIPNSVTSIGEAAFSCCYSLTSITIPNSVSLISHSAFSGCSGLTSITSKAIIPPLIYSNSFSDVNHAIPFYVPCNSLSIYQLAEYWRDFVNYKCDPIGLDDELKFSVSTKLYPNPTSNKAILEVEGLKSEVDILVYDMEGRVILRHKLSKGERELDIDLTGFAKGVYSIRIMNDSINQTKKLIVQ